MKANKLIGSNAATVFIFGYGLITQIIAFAIIYFFISHYPIRESVVEAIIFLWYCIPVIAVFSIIIAVIQINKRIRNHERYKTPLIGLILSLAWLLGYLYMISWAFADKMPLLFK